VIIRRLFVSLSLAALAAFACPATPVSPDLTIRPYGWADFCKRSPSLCYAEHKPEVIALSAHRLAQIVEVNRAVNKGTVYQTDLEHYGTVEFWTYPQDTTGDCEDYALEKQRRLANLGLPRSALLITMVSSNGDNSGWNHAVLTVKTTAGDFVLDNQTNEILRPEQTGHTFLARQSRTRPNAWVYFGDDV
jgi:predicted transglutaminase-like cysteine proteinase